MPDSPDLTLDVLRRIQSDPSVFRAETNDRLDRLEVSLRRERRDTSGGLVIARATAGHLSERMAGLERRLAAFDQHSP